MRDKNLKILILVGPPAAGKSTWAKEFIRKNPKYIRVGRDDFRFMFKDAPITENKVEKLISEMQEEVIMKALAKKLNVIVDNTHLKEKYINSVVNLVKYKADVEYRLFDISYEKALERDDNRKKKVGENVLKRMFAQFVIFKDTFHFQNHTMLKREVAAKEYIDKLVKHNSNLPDAVIFDIDGTIAIMNRHPFNWKKVNKDLPNDAVINYTHIHKNLGHRVILMSGRDCAARDLTEKWLKDNNVYYDELHMRGELSGGPNQDYRKDNIIKEELYNKFIKDKYNVLVVFDDRTQVVKLWRKLGLVCFQVNISPD